ncbi:DUF4347 domain-containing protein, partial [Microcoleus sp. Pol11C2]|uniref:DUF4347 domain-containing protein n=1 Tax=Microcoleus sp. Pol11C2 TaxID=3055389 RepID=UPI002FD18AF1
MPNLNNQVSPSAIAFIDTLVENYQSLVAGVKAGTEVVVLDGNRDAIDQITEILGDRSNIDSIHIISHGSSGSLQLGDVRFSLDDIECDRQDLQQWFSPQTDSIGQNRPNILLYGCCVAAGETGKAFVKRLSQLTGARVAASENLTGSVTKGGDWELEVRTGKIETPLVFAPEVLAGYEYVLNTFGAATNIGAGTNPYGIATGDFDLDGKPDLAVTNQGSDTVSILLGNGTGGFNPAPIPSLAATRPTSIAIGNFNNDNFPDLAVVGSGTGGALSIFLGNGTGGFGSPTQYPTGVSPISVAVGKFNGDNFSDVAVVNANPTSPSGTVTILLANSSGSGALNFNTNLSAQSIPAFMTVGDFNGDTFSDLAVPNSVSNNISIFLGNGTGNFGAATNFGAGQNPNSIANGDFNGDNFLDLAVVNTGSNNVSILLGNGTGGFGTPTNFSAGTGLQGVVANDFSGDGKLDLAVGGTSGAAILVGNGSGGFSTAINFAAGTDPTFIIAGNFNADTLPDLALANNSSDNVSVLLNTPNTVSFVPPKIGNTYNVNEGATDTVIDVPVTISGGTPLSDVTVPIVIDPSSTATQGADYTLSTTSLTFSAGTTTLTQNIAVTIKADNIVDSNEQLVLNFGTITGGVADASQGKVAILDRNSSYSIVADNPTVTEGNFGKTPATFTITRNGSTELWSTVDYTIAGTATNGSDYNNIGGTSGATAATGKITLAAGETSKTITLEVLGDGLIEPDETVAITLSNPVSPGGAPTIPTPTATTTITNDDAADFSIAPTNITATEGGATGSYKVKLTSEPTAPVNISFNTGNAISPIAQITFDSTDWNVEKTVTVTAIDDNVAQGTHSGTIAHTVTSSDASYNAKAIPDVTASITDNDSPGVSIVQSAGSTNIAEGGAAATYGVVLTTAPAANVTINFATGSQISAIAPLTFTPTNWNVAQDVTVSAIEDSIAEATHSGTIAHTSVSDDTLYNGLTISPVTATIADNDTAGVTISATSTTATEGGATGGIYSVKLKSEPLAPVTVSFATGEPINPIAPITFDSTNWNVDRTVTVSAIDDSIAQGTHGGTITHTSASTDTKYNALTISPVTATIADNDTAGVTISPTSTTANEGGAGTYSIQLTSVPTAPVTISFANGSQINAIADVTFDSTNWNIPKAVTVTATDDAVVEGNHTGSISHTAVSADTKYSALPIPGVTVAIADNDTAPLVVVEPPVEPVVVVEPPVEPPVEPVVVVEPPVEPPVEPVVVV